MKRRNFFRTLGIGAAAVVVAPEILKAADDVVLRDLPTRTIPSTLMNPYPVELDFRPNVVIVTKSPEINGIAGSSVKIGLSDNARVGSTIYIPSLYIKYGGKKAIPVGFRIMSKDLNGICTIAPFLAKMILKDIPVGTELILGASTFSMENRPITVREQISLDGTQYSLKEYK